MGAVNGPRGESSAQRGRVADLFHNIARATSSAMGSPWAFVSALAIVVIWAMTGPVFHYSDTWQLVINTGTTIVTFLMVFLIQSSQNRDAEAMQLKLDEIIKSIEPARNQLINLENLSEEEIKRIRKEFERFNQGTQTPCEPESSQRNSGEPSQTR